MIPSRTIAGIAYVIAGVGLGVLGRIRGNPRTMDFETGLGAGLTIAGVLELLATLTAMLP